MLSTEGVIHSIQYEQLGFRSGQRSETLGFIHRNCFVFSTVHDQPWHIDSGCCKRNVEPHFAVLLDFTQKVGAERDDITGAGVCDVDESALAPFRYNVRSPAVGARDCRPGDE
jgi:hypothetical protein